MGFDVWGGPRRCSLRAFAWLMVVALLAAGLPAPEAAGRERQRNERRGGTPSIVVLPDGADPLVAAAELGVVPRHVYRDAFTGFAADLPPSAVTAASTARGVRRIEPDGQVSIQGRSVDDARSGTNGKKRPRRKHQNEPQQTPTGVRRVNAAVAIPSGNLSGDVPGIAVIDTGVSKVSDLEVSGGKACVGKDPFADGNGHGTHVAGTAAAIDNQRNVVGVAPGARIIAVKVLEADGNGRWSDVICGLDWVVRNKDSQGIDVVNMSLAGPGSDRGDCGGALHAAVCAVVEAGIPVVVAAGNQGTDVSERVPASFPEAITVAALADSNGRPGGGGPLTCDGDQDDTRWDSSNYGAGIDIAAPGSCIRSLRPDRGTVRYSGTSMASPHVAGALALFFAANPNADRAAAEAWLIDEASVANGSPEGCLDCGGPQGWDAPALWFSAP